MPATSLDRVRTAMKFSLWAWAAYWPAMGLMLLLGGMRDPVSVVVVIVSLASFGMLALGGALRASSSRTIKEFLLERPFYLIAILVAFLALGAILPAAAKIGLGLFSLVYLASLVLFGARVIQHVNETGLGVFRAKADQALLLLLIMLPSALLVFIDSLGGSGVGNPAPTVAAVNWLNLSYPALLLLASRPLREPLQLARLRRKGSVKVVKAEGTPQLAE